MKQLLWGTCLGAALSAALPANVQAQVWEPTGGIEQYGYYRQSYDPWFGYERYWIAYSHQLGYKFYNVKGAYAGTTEHYYPSAYRLYPNVLYSTTVYRQGPWPYYYGYNPLRDAEGAGFHKIDNGGEK
jgi:hypothetical protein